MKTEIFRKFDWIIFIDVIFITLIGLLFIYSAQLRTGNPMFFLIKQSTALGLGIAAMLIIISIRYELYSEYTNYFYIFGLILLVAVLFFGIRVRGAKSWFDFGKFAFQPSEIVKIVLILYIAKYINKNYYHMKKFSRLLTPFFATILYIGLILLEPDFSSAIVFIPILLGMVYIGGVSKKTINLVLIFFIVTLGLPFLEIFLTIKISDTSLVNNFKFIYIISVILISIGILLFIKAIQYKINKKEYKIIFLIILLGLISAMTISGYLKDYQKKRIIVFLDPSLDPLGSGYNILQSRIAIGSGKITGRGLFQGTQTQLGFIPDQHTDYIFAVIAEEGGAIVSILVICLYIVLIWRGITIARNASDKFGSLTAVGIVIMFSFYIILNLGMLTGIMPVAGVPLPFLSYGGSSLIVNFIAIGILINIHIRRFAY
ncbi:MAG: rod shape-determining protein RodA [Elusimicrobia bacterium RIFOXYD2_FULL_34_30]|nr:MAG: rod shape-determining protein RodA [Elusimicrobia bacterium RIFOXYD2_FULL_34_30]